MLKQFLALAISIATAWPCIAQVADFSSAPLEGKFNLNSWSPSSVDEFLLGRHSKEYAKRGVAVAHLKFPSGYAAGNPLAKPKIPAVVLMHGVGGFKPERMLDLWPKVLNEAGYAVLSIDSFSGRGIIDLIAQNSNALTPYASVADVYAGLESLVTHPHVDTTRVAVMGFSRGGAVAWLSAVSAFAKANLPDGLRFAATIPFYAAHCNGLTRPQIKLGVFEASPMLWVHGTADNWAPAKACHDLSNAINASGGQSEFLMLNGAHHSFDAADPRRYFIESFIENEACPLEYDLSEKQFHDRFSGKKLDGNQVQMALMMSCMKFGRATVQGDADATARSAAAVKTFLAKTFTAK